MAYDKPVHIPKQLYPELSYPQAPTIPFKLDEESESNRLHLLDYWYFVINRKWTILATVATLFVVTLIATLKQTPMYSATATIEIDKESQNILSFKSVYEVDSATDDTLRTQYEVLKLRTLARRVIEDLHLDRIEEFQPGPPSTFSSFVQGITTFFASPSQAPTGEPDRLRPFIDEYLNRLEVSPVRLARLVNVNFTSKDPALAARIINAHAKHYIEQNFQFQWDATQQATEFLSQQLVSLKSNLEKAEDGLQEYSRTKEILFTDEGRNTATEKLQQLEQEYTKAQADRIQKESYNTLIKSNRADDLPQLKTNSLLTTLSARLAELQREESELSVTFSAEYPRRKRIRSQVEEIQNNVQSEKDGLVKTTQAEYVAAVERERLLQRAVEDQRGVVNRTNQEIIQYNILKREVDSNKQLYNGLLVRLKEAGISAGLHASNVRVVDLAEIPRSPVSPKKTLNIAISLLAGLVIGFGIAVMQEYLDDSVKTGADVGKFFGVPVLAVIPQITKSMANPYGQAYASNLAECNGPPVIGPPSIDLIAHESPSSATAEAYRSLRTSLLLSSPDHAPRTILVTSAVPSEGKTVTAINTAISLTQVGSRVVLIDTDMRRPRIRTVFPSGDTRGLSSFLTGAATLKEIIQKTPIPNLYVINCGIPPPNPGELIVSSRFRELIGILREYFDYAVLDSPPLTNVSDARILASVCDASILVAKAGSTSRRLVKHALDSLTDSSAVTVGLVLNDVDARVRATYYGSAYPYPQQSPKTGQ